MRVVYLLHADLRAVAPFCNASFPFRTAEGEPRMVTVVHGGGGVGKTSLLQVLAHSRPGHAAALMGRTMPGSEVPAHAVCEWLLGDDDPDRPHPLVVMTPNVRPAKEDDAMLLRRREQALFDRVAKERGGFVFLSISAARWFSRQSVSLHAPVRTVAHYDIRATASFDDATHSDLTRETKSALAYAGVAAALAPTTQRERNLWRGRQAEPVDTRLFGLAMKESVNALASLAGFAYEGVDPVSLEPTFTDETERPLLFDRLPTRARHLVSFAALTVRTLWAAYPGKDPRTAQGVVAIDEVDLHQDDAIAEQLVGTLRETLPRVQWILTTSSPAVAASVDSRDVLALRRLPEREHVDLFVGAQARTH